MLNCRYDKYEPRPYHTISQSISLNLTVFLLSLTGFLRQTPRACCGAPGVGEYNFNLTSKCGDPGSYACDDPSNHWSWDGIHLTEASYGHIAKGWLYGPFADPPILEKRHH
uniref:GDSL esterase/lipase n=1 Tax=Leersia perrieri TaxID=77586 RepID=A0A0D9UYA7_9ORYZ